MVKKYNYLYKQALQQETEAVTNSEYLQQRPYFLKTARLQGTEAYNNMLKTAPNLAKQTTLDSEVKKVVSLVATQYIANTNSEG